MANPGPSNAESGAAVPKIVYTKSFLDLADLTFSDPETRTLSRPLPVKSKKELCRIVALGRYKPYNLEFPIGFKSAYTYFDWMNPTTGNLVRYITTVLDDGSFEIKASTSPQDSRPFIGKTVTAAWVALTRGINEHMPEGAKHRRENLAFKDFIGSNSDVLRYLFDQMKAEDLGYDAPVRPPNPLVKPAHLEYQDEDEEGDDGPRRGADGRIFRSAKRPRKGKVIVEDGGGKRVKGAAEDVISLATTDPVIPVRPKPKVLLSDPNLRPRHWEVGAQRITTISGSSIVLGGWFSKERRQVTHSTPYRKPEEAPAG